ncbi:hypothetical protein BWQ96_05224 [Gracilariopsis chorda]|uniref:Uncharacterized protein n=1 Tax=Gracilariopsis chorda TaxID=448386 RepID=A0A2V3ISC3_9FLOR|nr:hypothetical protein BWQ96_05224 [Gracilariopsis chorda]|eukprot:PXF45021.1 hypothetical protein BWQ96_05224 [Gracilariopsis chorda]
MYRRSKSVLVAKRDGYLSRRRRGVLGELMGYPSFRECLTEGNVETGGELEDRAYYMPLSLNTALRDGRRKGNQENR